MAASALAVISKSTIRERAVKFADDHADDHSEQAQRQLFWADLFGVFGLNFAQFAAFEARGRRASTGGIGFIDLLFSGEMAVEHKSLDEDLDEAMKQVHDYLPGLSAAEHPWLLIACDFQTFRWENLNTGDKGDFALSELPDHLDLFYWMAGYNRPGVQYDNEEDANLEATALLATVHDELAATGYPEHDLRVWMTRVLFCLFADDSGVWDRATLHAYLAARTNSDGSDLGPTLAHVFELLDQPPDQRTLPDGHDLESLAHVNGDLFAERITMPYCNEHVWDALLTACSFNWATVSPAIFGSLFQNVMTPVEQRDLGAHYTTEENILKVIQPLFLDELQRDLQQATSLPKLHAFHDRISTLTFFDPACGCGNFLVVTYRELRRLETECLRRIREKEGTTDQRAVGLDLLCKVTVDQFYGIEIEEFPSRIAVTALYLADHLANRDVTTEFGEHYARFPIPAAPHIVTANALTTSWEDVLATDNADYVFGNPPFSGQHTRGTDQTAELRAVWGDDFARWLDYVTAWYRLAVDYMHETDVRAAFVSTNSIVQGEQIGRMWGPLLERGLVIDFAHQTFEWTSEIKSRAHVHVVIIGFSVGNSEVPKTVYTYDSLRADPQPVAASQVNPYLLDAPPVLVRSRTTALSPVLPPVKNGNKPADGGNLIFDEGDLPPGDDPAFKYIRPYVGARELLHGERRWCIWMTEPDQRCIRSSPFLKSRVDAVRAVRSKSTAADTRKCADYPWRFFRTPQPNTAYIAIPGVVSATREWFTVAHLDPETIASNALFTATDDDGFLFGVLSSAMFTSWLCVVGGRLKSDLRFSGPVVYNTFPLADVTDEQRRRVVKAGANVLDARQALGDLSLAEMYDPLAVPAALRTAHRELDLAVDRLFTGRGRPADVTARMRLLWHRYAEMTDGDLSLFEAAETE